MGFYAVQAKVPFSSGFPHLLVYSSLVERHRRCSSEIVNRIASSSLLWSGEREKDGKTTFKLSTTYHSQADAARSAPFEARGDAVGGGQSGRCSFARSPGGAGSYRSAPSLPARASQIRVDR